MNHQQTFLQIRKNALRVNSLTIDSELFEYIGEIVENCRNLIELRIGKPECQFNHTGSVWSNQVSINEFSEVIDSQSGLDESDEEEGFELDARLIASNLHALKYLHIDTGLQIKRLPVAPPTLPELVSLEVLRLCPIKPGVRCDRSRDEKNLRILSQSSKNLKILDLRGCYLKILSLGWLETTSLESLHIFYQVPAASVLQKWTTTLKYLTLAKISSHYSTYRSMGPKDPMLELDACLETLAVGNESKLLQLDLQLSDFSPSCLKHLISNAPLLSYLDTRYCTKIPQDARMQCTDRSQIEYLLKSL